MTVFCKKHDSEADFRARRWVKDSLLTHSNGNRSVIMVRSAAVWVQACVCICIVCRSRYSVKSKEFYEWIHQRTVTAMIVQEQHQWSSSTLNICDRLWNGRPSVLLLLFTAQWGLKMNSVPVRPRTHRFCPDTVHKVGRRAGGKWMFRPKSRSDDMEIVLGRNIHVWINSSIHLIRPRWSMSLSSEWIQVIKLELLPRNGNASLATESSH